MGQLWTEMEGIQYIYKRETVPCMFLPEVNFFFLIQNIFTYLKCISNSGDFYLKSEYIIWHFTVNECLYNFKINSNFPIADFMYFIRNLVTKQFISGSVYGICFIMNLGLGIYDKK